MRGVGRPGCGPWWVVVVWRVVWRVAREVPDTHEGRGSRMSGSAAFVRRTRSGSRPVAPEGRDDIVGTGRDTDVGTRTRGAALDDEIDSGALEATEQTGAVGQDGRVADSATGGGAVARHAAAAQGSATQTGARPTGAEGPGARGQHEADDVGHPHDRGALHGGTLLSGIDGARAPAWDTARTASGHPDCIRGLAKGATELTAGPPHGATRTPEGPGIIMSQKGSRQAPRRRAGPAPTRRRGRACARPPRTPGPAARGPQDAAPRSP